MSSILVSELKTILDNVPDDYEVIMNIHHKYDISKEEGLVGWLSFVNGIHIDDERKEILLQN